MPQFEYSKLSQPDDIQQLGSIISQCFIAASGDEELYINRIGKENYRLIRKNETLIGGLAMMSMGQWWGSQRVPMAGIAGVGIAPEYRGDGAAIALLHYTLKELQANGVPISVLYPATQRLYRKVGYEQGGSYCLWEVPTESIQMRQQPLPLTSVVPINKEVFFDLYNQQAKRHNGYLDRHSAIWERLVTTNNQQRLFAYLIGNFDQPQGYIIFTQERTENNTILWVRDWVILTNAALHSFWAFMSNHRSQIDLVRWYSSAIDALTLSLPEQTAKILHPQRWMLRVLDVVKALEARGYPVGIQAELHLEVKDDLLAANNGRFILSVANGRGEVTSGGKGELQLDIGALAPLYTGLFTPYHLQLGGKLDARETALSIATVIFAGAFPGMPDFF